jgi:hypothetical protein
MKRAGCSHMPGPALISANLSDKLNETLMAEAKKK